LLLRHLADALGLSVSAIVELQSAPGRNPAAPFSLRFLCHDLFASGDLFALGHDLFAIK
jgi:hypothetical protein